MKRVLLSLFFVVMLTGGCATNRPWYESQRHDPVVGRTVDGHRIYEDRNGRLYTIDRHGRRVYGDSGYYERDPEYRGKYKGKHGRYGARGNTRGHPEKHR